MPSITNNTIESIYASEEGIVVAPFGSGKQFSLVEYPGTLTKDSNNGADFPNNAPQESFKLRNALFDYTNQLLVEPTYQGFPSNASMGTYSAFDQRDSVCNGWPHTYLYQWRPAGAQFTNLNDWRTELNLGYHSIQSPFKTLGANEPLQPRIISLFGCGGDMSGLGKNEGGGGAAYVQATTQANQDIFNSYSYSDVTNYNPLAGAVGIDIAGTWAMYSISQVIPILAVEDISPGGKFKVGAQFRFPTDDRMQANNFAGFTLTLVHGDETTTNIKNTIQTVIFRDATQYPNKAAMDLTEGTFAGDTNSSQTNIRLNFRGLFPDDNTTSNGYGQVSWVNYNRNTHLEHVALLDIDDYKNFKDFTIELPVDSTYETGAKAILTFFYAENISNYLPSSAISLTDSIRNRNYSIVDVGNATQEQLYASTGVTKHTKILTVADIELNARYTIVDPAEIDFTQFGASANTAGEVFIATAPGADNKVELGKTYVIVEEGDTDWLDLGKNPPAFHLQNAPLVGMYFIATKDSEDIGTGKAALASNTVELILGGFRSGTEVRIKTPVSGTTCTLKEYTGAMQVFSPHVEYVD